MDTWTHEDDQKHGTNAAEQEQLLALIEPEGSESEAVADPNEPAPGKLLPKPLCELICKFAMTDKEEEIFVRERIHYLLKTNILKEDPMQNYEGFMPEHGSIYMAFSGTPDDDCDRWLMFILDRRYLLTPTMRRYVLRIESGHEDAQGIEETLEIPHGLGFGCYIEWLADYTIRFAKRLSESKYVCGEAPTLKVEAERRLALPYTRQGMFEALMDLPYVTHIPADGTMTCQFGTSSIGTFNFDEHSLTAFGTHDKPWFCMTEVRDLVGKGDPWKMVENLDDDEKKKMTGKFYRSSKTREQWFVSEAGLLTLIVRGANAKKKGTFAWKLRRWVFHEVIPAIRKHGKYELTNQIKLLTDRAEAAEQQQHDAMLAKDIAVADKEDAEHETKRAKARTAHVSERARRSDASAQVARTATRQAQATSQRLQVDNERLGHGVWCTIYTRLGLNPVFDERRIPNQDGSRCLRVLSELKRLGLVPKKVKGQQRDLFKDMDAYRRGCMVIDSYLNGEQTKLSKFFSKKQ